MTSPRLVSATLLSASLLAACSSTHSPLALTSPSPSPTSSGPSASAPATPGAPSSTPGAGRPAAVLHWHSCDSGFQCATLTTPLDDAHPDKGTVDIAVARHQASGPGSRLGSLVINPGGPGASAVDFMERDVTGIPSEIRARFDLVAFDPRGVGRSAPVRCGTTAELDADYGVDPDPDTSAELTAFESANASFAKGCQRRSGRVLPFVSTQLAADDLDRVRAAIGDAKLTYLGYSYGTAIGAAYLDRYPTRVRAMVLDGALDPALTWDQVLSGQAAGFEQAFAAFLADCQANDCAFRKAVQGDLGKAFDALAEKVDRNPLPVGNGRALGAAEFAYGVGEGLYSRSTGWPDIAAGLARAEQGDGSVLMAMSDSYVERDQHGYTNTVEANVAVNCLDRPWPSDPGAYTALAKKIRASAPRFGPGIVLSGMTCAFWPVPAQGRPHRVSGTGAPPVLVIGGTRDPATPYAWAQQLVGELSSGVLLTHQGDGHTVYRSGGPGCITDPVDRYLLTLAAPSALTC